MRKYAERTDVPVDKSKREIEQLLVKAGASSVATLIEGTTRCAVGFKLDGRGYRFMVPMPLPHEIDKTPTGYKRTAEAMRNAREQGIRQRWRALALILRAKLEAAQSGITALEIELLPYAILPGGRSVAEDVLPRLAEAYSSGKDVPLLPGTN
jgi:hypothetical protein